MPHPRIRFVLSTWLVLGCAAAPVVHSPWSGKPGRARAVASETTAAPATDPALAAEMHGRLDELSLIEPYVIRGDFVRAKSLGAELLERVRHDDGPVEWAPHVAALRVEMRALVNADDLVAGAQATARVAAGCGSCHEAVGAVPELDDAPMPAGGSDEHAAMRLHAWSMARLREGLVGPSVDRWLQGTATFAALPGCSEPDAARVELCTRVKRLAHRAHVADTSEARVHLYGELLATCADCHAQ